MSLQFQSQRYITCLLPRQLYEDLPIRYCANALISTIRENKPINSAISNRKEGSYRQIPNHALAKTMVESSQDKNSPSK